LVAATISLPGTPCALELAARYVAASGIIMIAIVALILDACLRGLLLLADPSRRR
jgi:hypothetical protein